jgi:hypothetical protein
VWQKLFFLNNVSTGEKMSPDKENKLYDNYPELFYSIGENPELTLMWGIECEDGWYDIIDCLCHEIIKKSRKERSLERSVEEYEEAMKKFERIPSIIQIKEKFGLLTVYINNINKEHKALIDFAERLSSKTCEFCGTSKDVKLTSVGWIKTLCPEHTDLFNGRKV